MAKTWNYCGYRIRETYCNNLTALCTEEVSPDLWALICEWQDLNGRDAVAEVRGYRVNARGLVTFKHGVGYDIISDLLGGPADGVRRGAFADWVRESGVWGASR